MHPSIHPIQSHPIPSISLVNSHSSLWPNRPKTGSTQLVNSPNRSAPRLPPKPRKPGGSRAPGSCGKRTVHQWTGRPMTGSPWAPPSVWQRMAGPWTESRLTERRRANGWEWGWGPNGVRIGYHMTYHGMKGLDVIVHFVVWTYVSMTHV